MHPLFFFLSFFFSLQPHHLSSPIPFLSPNRRILYEPFLPLDALPPSQPPNQPQPPLPPPIFPSSTSSNPKHPFSTTTPYQSSPFFPFYPYPSPPPPPPPPTSFSTYASFPANISSLLIPHSLQPQKSSSGRNLSLAITAVACTTIMVAISVFLFLRRKHYSTKTLTNSETETTNINQRLRHTNEFLYLGNTINSHRVEVVTDSGSIDCRKMESPELQPIPRLSLRQHEEFFSPKISSFCASESSSVNGLGLLRTRSFPSTSMLSSPEQNQFLSSSSERENGALSERTLPKVSNDSNGTTRESFAPASSSGFSLPSSPEKAMHCDILDESPTMSSFSDRYRLSCVSSVPLSPTLVSSPERELSHVWNESEKFGTQRKQHWEIPVFSIPTAPPSHGVSLSLPTPTPLLPRWKQWAAISAPVVGQPVAVSRPPELTPPSRPFVLLNPTTKVSHVELPISSRNSGEQCFKL